MVNDKCTLQLVFQLSFHDLLVICHQSLCCSSNVLLFPPLLFSTVAKKHIFLLKFVSDLAFSKISCYSKNLLKTTCNTDSIGYSDWDNEFL